MKVRNWLAGALLAAACLAPAARAQSNLGFGCQSAQNYSSATLTATTQLIAVPTNISGLSIHICSYELQVSQTASPVTFGLVSGTGSACATNQALVTPQYMGFVSTVQLVGEAYSADGGFSLPAGTNLCLKLGGTPTGAVVHVTWAAY